MRRSAAKPCAHGPTGLPSGESFRGRGGPFDAPLFEAYGRERASLESAPASGAAQGPAESGERP